MYVRCVKCGRRFFRHVGSRCTLCLHCWKEKFKNIKIPKKEYVCPNCSKKYSSLPLYLEHLKKCDYKGLKRTREVKE